MALLLSISRELTPSRFADRYEIVSRLADGGYGSVWAAQHTVTGQPVALKFLRGDPNDVALCARFLREGQTLGRLRHPNTVRVLDAGSLDNGRLFIAMERLEGETLEQRLLDACATGKPMSESVTLHIAVSILAALVEAHSYGIVHRDLKPANIMLSRVGDQTIVRVLDFGMAALTEKGPTAEDCVPGTPAYMSPEQCQGQKVDGRSDLYALGVVLFRCVTLQEPFGGRDVLATMYGHVHRPAPDVLSAATTPVRAELAAIIGRALSKQPCDRYDDASDMLAALDAVSHAHSGETDRAQSHVDENHDMESRAGEQWAATVTSDRLATFSVDDDHETNHTKTDGGTVATWQQKATAAPGFGPSRNLLVRITVVSGISAGLTAWLVAGAIVDRSTPGTQVAATQVRATQVRATQVRATQVRATGAAVTQTTPTSSAASVSVREPRPADASTMDAMMATPPAEQPTRPWASPKPRRSANRASANVHEATAQRRKRRRQRRRGREGRPRRRPAAVIVRPPVAQKPSENPVNIGYQRSKPTIEPERPQPETPRSAVRKQALSAVNFDTPDHRIPE